MRLWPESLRKEAIDGKIYICIYVVNWPSLFYWQTGPCTKCQSSFKSKPGRSEMVNLFNATWSCSKRMQNRNSSQPVLTVTHYQVTPRRKSCKVRIYCCFPQTELRTPEFRGDYETAALPEVVAGPVRAHRRKVCSEKFFVPQYWPQWSKWGNKY